MRCRMPGSAVPPGRAESPPAVPSTTTAGRRTPRTAHRSAPHTGLPSTALVHRSTPRNTDQAGRPSA
ncbi:hypothetical protein [Kitasatospora sp. NPDC051914]|uniref:hypothetical protein n=1 Tax=Kitasatospora sp. NPDC051914 TaxID=3154945 RepID=UPI00343B69ED